MRIVTKFKNYNCFIFNYSNSEMLNNIRKTIDIIPCNLLIPKI